MENWSPARGQPHPCFKTVGKSNMRAMDMDIEKWEDVTNAGDVTYSKERRNGILLPGMKST